MDNKDKRLIYVARFQNNLAVIRKMAGWSAEALGHKVGLSKQTISAIETGRSPMSIVQYIALRAMFDYEIQHNQETGPVLEQVIKMLVDDPMSEDSDNIVSDSDLNKYSSDSGTILGVNSIGVIAGAVSVVGSFWMNSIFKK